MVLDRVEGRLGEQGVYAESVRVSPRCLTRRSGPQGRWIFRALTVTATGDGSSGTQRIKIHLGTKKLPFEIAFQTVHDPLRNNQLHRQASFAIYSSLSQRPFKQNNGASLFTVG
jgi:hypothetical protein